MVDVTVDLKLGMFNRDSCEIWSKIACFTVIHNMLRHEAYPFLLVHNNDFEAFGHGFWSEMPSGLSSVLGV
ncbi:hypothetical protein L484_005393 [Morus notabilis]|uniref:Uncharacterized protein n=1 Tax=Morus notabilis TaxID=981085 RepID=W9RNG2_9ROSA|nr:hypothetical protein L484_005393 [Morus notabilis]